MFFSFKKNRFRFKVHHQRKTCNRDRKYKQSMYKVALSIFFIYLFFFLEILYKVGDGWLCKQKILFIFVSQGKITLCVKDGTKVSIKDTLKVFPLSEIFQNLYIYENGYISYLVQKSYFPNIKLIDISNVFICVLKGYVSYIQTDSDRKVLIFIKQD